MKHQRGILFVIVVLTGLGISGCANSVNDPDGTFTKNDAPVLKSMIENDPLFTSDSEILDDNEFSSFSQASLGKTTVPIVPVRWGRKVVSRVRDTNFETLNDTTVVATVTHTIKGDFIILGKAGTQDSLSVFKKPFTTVTTRKVRFYRHGRTGNPALDWRPDEVSGVAGGSIGSQVSIARAEVFAGSETFSVTDPTHEFFQLRRTGRLSVPIINLFQPMKIRATVISTDPDTDWVSLHRPFSLLIVGPNHVIRTIHIRMQLVSQVPVGGGYERVYEYSWIGGIVGRHTVFVEAVARGTLFDDTAPVSTQLWGVPYIVQ